MAMLTTAVVGIVIAAASAATAATAAAAAVVAVASIAVGTLLLPLLRNDFLRQRPNAVSESIVQPCVHACVRV
jgi:hypothetical protein